MEEISIGSWSGVGQFTVRHWVRAGKVNTCQKMFGNFLKGVEIMGSKFVFVENPPGAVHDYLASQCVFN